MSTPRTPSILLLDYFSLKSDELLMLKASVKLKASCPILRHKTYLAVVESVLEVSAPCCWLVAGPADCGLWLVDLLFRTLWLAELFTGLPFVNIGVCFFEDCVALSPKEIMQ